jgi:hypothetical protein
MQVISGQASWSGFQVFEETPVPEPSTLTLLGIGVVLIAIRRARRP